MRMPQNNTEVLHRVIYGANRRPASNSVTTKKPPIAFGTNFFQSAVTFRMLMVGKYTTANHLELNRALQLQRNIKISGTPFHEDKNRTTPMREFRSELSEFKILYLIPLWLKAALYFSRLYSK